VDSPSYDEYANAKPLNRGLMKWFFDHYAPGWQTQTEELISLVEADLNGLPSTTIFNAEIGPLAPVVATGAREW
jgi:acetyl esterase